MLRWGKDKKPEKPEEAPRPKPKAKATPTPAARAEPARSAPRAQPRPAAAEGAAPQTLEQVLVGTGRITAEQLEKALDEQKKTGLFLGQVLVDLGFIDENSLTSFLAKHCRIPHLSLLDYLIDESQLELIPKDVCLKYRLLPIDKLGKNLTVAMVNPLNREALEAVRKLCPNLRIKPILCAWNHYEAVTRRVFGAEGKAGAAPELTASQLGMGPSTTAAPPKPAAAPEPAVAPPEPAAPPEPEPAAAAVPEAAEKEAEGEFEDVLSEVFSGKAQEEEAEGEAAVATAEAAPEPSPAEEEDEGAGSIMSEMISVMRDSMRDTYAMLARRMELFRDIQPEIVAKIFSQGITAEYEAGNVIFEKGDESNELYAILGGKVDIFDGGYRLASLSRGDMFGEMALAGSESRSATAKAVETTSLLVLTFDVLRNALPKEAAIQLLVNIVLCLSNRVRDANMYIHTHLKDSGPADDA